MPGTSPWSELPDALRAERIDDIAVLTLARPAKRNALSDEAVLGIERFFDGLPTDVRAVVIDADGLYMVGQDVTVVKGYRRAVLTPNVVEFRRLSELVVRTTLPPVIAQPSIPP